MSFKDVSLSSSPDVLRLRLDNSRRTVWLGALSFEERCVGSLVAIQNSGLHIDQGIAFNYDTQVFPLVEDKHKRATNWQRLTDHAATLVSGGVQQFEIASYSFHELQMCVDMLNEQADLDFVIFDITCFSKIHTLALAAALAQGVYRFGWAIAYTVPENYSNLDQSVKSIGWKDIIVAPLAETASLFNEAHSRGVIMPGHDSDRLIVALAELEPSGGLILVAETEKRPDLRILCERNNRKVIRQLTRMRSRDWSSEVVGLTELEGVRDALLKEIVAASEYKAPVILFPYGPKSLIFYTALQVCSEYPEAAWFVYPVPAAYDVNYSEGIEKTLWLMYGGKAMQRPVTGGMFDGDLMPNQHVVV
jgi:hypothetical protein